MKKEINLLIEQIKLIQANDINEIELVLNKSSKIITKINNLSKNDQFLLKENIDEMLQHFELLFKILEKEKEKVIKKINDLNTGIKSLIAYSKQ